MRFFFYLFLLYALTLKIGYAKEYGSTNHLIHYTTIKIKGRCCPAILISTKVGHLQNGTCHYERETLPTDYGFCGPERIYPLSGQRLADLVGSGYNCGATIATLAMRGSEMEEYLLYSDNLVYSHTMPSRGIINMNYQCH